MDGKSYRDYDLFKEDYLHDWAHEKGKSDQHHDHDHQLDHSHFPEKKHNPNHGHIGQRTIKGNK